MGRAGGSVEQGMAGKHLSRSFAITPALSPRPRSSASAVFSSRAVSSLQPGGAAGGGTKLRARQPSSVGGVGPRTSWAQLPAHSWRREPEVEVDGRMHRRPQLASLSKKMSSSTLPSSSSSSLQPRAVAVAVARSIQDPVSQRGQICPGLGGPRSYEGWRRWQPAVQRWRWAGSTGTGRGMDPLPGSALTGGSLSNF